MHGVALMMSRARLPGIFILYFAFIASIFAPPQACAEFWMSGQYGPESDTGASFMLVGGDFGFLAEKGDGAKGGIGFYFLKSNDRSGSTKGSPITLNHTMYGIEAVARSGIGVFGAKLGIDRYCGAPSIGGSRLKGCSNAFALGPFIGLDLPILGPLSIGAETTAFAVLSIPLYVSIMAMGVVRFSF